MTQSEAMIKMVRAINSNNKEVFYDTFNGWISTLKPGALKESMLSVYNRRPMEMQPLNMLPRETKGLVHEDLPELDFFFLNDDVKPVIRELNEEWDAAHILRERHIPVRNKILLYGPSGNGKTTLARHIAKSSERSFYQLKLEEIIGSHMGESGKNLMKIMEAIKGKSIIFVDEIDSVASARMTSTNSAGSENNRIVNTLIVSLDRQSEDVVFIAATNRREDIDPAILRRFDLQIEILGPTDSQKHQFANALQLYHGVTDCPSYKVLSDCESYAAIKSRLIDFFRRCILKEIKSYPTQACYE